MIDSELAPVIAERAGEALLSIRANAQANLVDAERLRALGDRGAQIVIAGMLGYHRPDDAVLSEEATDDAVRLQSDRVWIIDPLDGTREYSEGRDDWAVHVALWQSGELTAGAVALPAEGIVLSSHNVPAVPTRGEGPLRIAVSRSRPPAISERVALALGAELVPLGSAGFKASAVVRGHVDAWIHAGGQYEWDSAAPVAVALAAGAHASRIDGSPLLYNQAGPYLPDVMICRSEIAAIILKAIRTAGEAFD